MPSKPRSDNAAPHEQSVTIDPVRFRVERKSSACVL